MLHFFVLFTYRTNLPKEIMNLGDFLYPDHLPSFLHHTDVRTYLDRYTLHYALDQVIRHNTRVLCVRPYGNGGGSSDKPVGWRVAYQDLKTQKTNVEEFDGVVVCNGLGLCLFLSYFCPLCIRKVSLVMFLKSYSNRVALKK